ncbi:hypothetical protein cypCar_00044284, partial [Cyprinus carpio]
MMLNDVAAFEAKLDLFAQQLQEVTRLIKFSIDLSQQSQVNIMGVEASKKLADLARMENYKSMITNVGREKQMDPAVFAAIISRQSRAGATLEDGWGDHGYAFGLMQVGGISAYNAGVSTVSSYENIDARTSGKDF